MASRTCQGVIAMKEFHIILAEKTQLIRSGLAAILKQTGYSFVFHEVVHGEKLIRTLHNHPASLLLISNSFLNSCSEEVRRNVFFENNCGIRVLIHDSEEKTNYDCHFHEIIETDDREKSIYLKLERQVRNLLINDNKVSPTEEISEREKAVLPLVALGMTNKEIAEKLFISSHTVITHRKNITSKLGIKTIAGLTVYAVLHKLIPFEELH